MCGISGIFGRGIEPEQLTAMVRTLAHRGPDDQGTWLGGGGERPAIALGHNRLSIIDLSADGHQPMTNRDGSLRLVLNGEIYNYLELRQQLDEYPYRSRTDSEVVLAAYERWGTDCLEHFNGMFAFALWDDRRRRLFCARDRMGIKPFYYCRLGERLLFASEIKALLAAGCPAELDAEVLHDYLVKGLYEHTGRTFFRRVRALPPGHFLLADESSIQGRGARHRDAGDRGPREYCYWSLAQRVEALGEVPDGGAPADWQDELRHLLDDAVRLRLRSDVPVGMHLSGGLDSSALLATLDHLMPSGSCFQAFTAVFGDARYDEAIHADRVSRELSLELERVPLQVEDFWAVAQAAQWHQEQPFGGVSTLGYWNMEAQARRRGITVLLEGQGGDELFGGYAYYLAERVEDLLTAGRETEASRLIEQSAQHLGVAKDALTAKVKRMRQGRGSLFQDGSSFLRTDCLHPDFVGGQGTDHRFVLPATSHFRRARVRDVRYSKLPRVLRFNDRMSMAFGRELRVPLLDHRIVEYSFRLDDALLLRDGVTKWPLRQVLRGRLEDEIRLAPKRAVVTPQKEWMRGPLRQGIRRRLEDSELARRGILDRQRALAAFDHFCQDHSVENAFYLWQWLNVDLWLRTFEVA